MVELFLWQPEDKIIIVCLVACKSPCENYH